MLRLTKEALRNAAMKANGCDVALMDNAKAIAHWMTVGLLPLFAKTIIPDSKDAEAWAEWLKTTCTHYINNPIAVDFLLLDASHAEVIMPYLTDFNHNAELSVTTLAMRPDQSLFKVAPYLPSVTLAHMLLEHAGELASAVFKFESATALDFQFESKETIRRWFANHLKAVLRYDILTQCQAHASAT